MTKLNGSLFKIQVNTHTHTLTLFTLPRYSSPSLHRANTSSPSLTPPILSRETERGERESERRESGARVKWKSDLFAEYFAAVADRGVYGPDVSAGSQDRRASVQRG